MTGDSDGVQDGHYLKRRENTIMVAVNCMPDEFCFCRTMAAESPPTHSSSLCYNRRVYMEPLTERGVHLIHNLSGKERFPSKK